MKPTQTWGLALLRIVLGAIYAMHGWLALSFGPAATAQYVIKTGVSEGVATPFAWYVIVAHLVGGVMLIVGFWTVLAALAQVPIIAGAVFLIHVPQGFYMRAMTTGGGGPMVGGYEYALLVLAATLAIALTGPGPLSIDDGRRHARRGRTYKVP